MVSIIDGAIAQDKPGTLSVLSFNVREWTRDTDSGSEYFWKVRMASMKKMIEDLDPDIICFQELLPPAGRYVPDSYSQVGISVSHPIYVRKSLSRLKHRFSFFWDSCIVEGIKIINVHSRWESRIVEKTVSQVNGQLTGRDIACGDWNTSLKAIMNSGLEMESARALLEIPETDTFANFTKAKSHGAIDHFFVKGLTPLSYRMITDNYGCTKMSDHFPILLVISL